MNIFVFTWSGSWSTGQAVVVDETEEAARVRAEAQLRAPNSGLILRLEDVLPMTDVVIVTTEQSPL